MCHVQKMSTEKFEMNNVTFNIWEIARLTRFLQKSLFSIVKIASEEQTVFPYSSFSFLGRNPSLTPEHQRVIIAQL